MHFEQIAHDLFRLSVAAQIVRAAENHDVRRSVPQDIAPESQHHFTRELATDAADGHARAGAEALLKKSSVRRLLDEWLVRRRRRLVTGRQTITEADDERDGLHALIPKGKS